MAMQGPSGGNEDEIIADINMTPLIDIMLVLIIIFMVTSTISSDSGLDINLPETSQGQAVKGEEQRPLIISLDKQGQIAIDGKTVSKEALKETIAQEMKTLNTTTVVFEGDKEAMLGEAIQIMDVAKEAGATKFAVATEQAAAK